MNNTLVVAPSPHVHGQLNTHRLMVDVLIALAPAWLVSFYMFGLSTLLTTTVSVVACVGFEYLFQRYILKVPVTINDCSAAVTGVLLAMNLPADIPFWIVLIGAFVAIGIAKMSFGGLGNNLFNPALAARALLLVSFPVQMTTWPNPVRCFCQYTDGTSGATVLAYLKQAIKGSATLHDLAPQMPSTLDMWLGNMGGSLGEVSAIALIVGGLYLLFRRVISWHIPVAVLVGAAALSGALWLANGTAYASPMVHLLSGGMLLGTIFMATDYVTSPMAHSGMLLYGLLIGLLCITIRTWGAYPEGMSFAILIMNAFVPLINRYFKPSKFGHKKLHA